MQGLKNAAGQIVSECRQALHRALSPLLAARQPSDSTQSIDGVLREMRRVGYVVLPSFMSRERCAALIARIDTGLAKYEPFVQLDLASSDHRLFGLDAVDDEIRRAAFDPFAVAVLKRYERATVYEGFALSARLTATPGNKGSGQGWHRDSAAYKQTKCMVYLTDVDRNTGPFQYIAGSHRPLDVVRCAARYGFDVNQFRFSDIQIEALLAAEPSRSRVLSAPAGTAILFDSRGLHRGVPILAGERYAITTYLWFNQRAPEHIRAWTIESQQRNGPARRIT